MDETELEAILDQQEKNAKLLVRRDYELLRANEQLRELDKLKTDFISVATHQMRTPLSAIKWALSILIKEELGPLNPEQKALAMKAYESSNRMVSMLSDVLLSERVESNRFEKSHIPSMMPDLAENVILELRPLAEQKQVTLVTHYAEEKFDPLPIDSLHMRAVLQNMLENAIKYSLPGGTVTLSAQVESSKFILTITDTGIGIPLDQQQLLFKRFFRANNAVKVETDGSGLGLYIVKQIIEQNHGTIVFTSREGEGTSFTITLPIST